MKFALFLGCTIPARCRNYELSARKVADRLGIEFVTINEFSCCGYPLKSMDRLSAYLLSARNLAIAEEQNLDIVTLCSSCTSMLQDTLHHARDSSEFLQDMNRYLKTTGHELKGGLRVKHFARMLIEDVGIEKIKENVSLPLDSLKIASHYGCHYLKPTHIYPDPEDPQNPTSLGLIIEALGAEQVHYLREGDCCGGPIMIADEKTALSIAKQKLDHIRDAGADLINLVCPFCSVMYDGNQKIIEKDFGVNYGIPVLYLPQILGLAFGFTPKELGFNLNVVKPDLIVRQLNKEGGIDG